MGIFKVPGDSNVQPEVMNSCLGPFKSAGSANLPWTPETRRGGRMGLHISLDPTRERQRLRACALPGNKIAKGLEMLP